MATLSDLKEMKEALDARLVTQADFDKVKRDYLRAKEEALEAKKEVEKENLEVKKQELRAKKEALRRTRSSRSGSFAPRKTFRRRSCSLRRRSSRGSLKRICGRTLSSRLSSTGPAS